MHLNKIVGKRVRVLVSFSNKVSSYPTSYEGIVEKLVYFGENSTFIKVDNHILNVNYIIDIELLD